MKNVQEMNTTSSELLIGWGGRCFSCKKGDKKINHSAGKLAETSLCVFPCNHHLLLPWLSFSFLSRCCCFFFLFLFFSSTLHWQRFWDLLSNALLRAQRDIWDFCSSLCSVEIDAALMALLAPPTHAHTHARGCRMQPPNAATFLLLPLCKHESTEIDGPPRLAKHREEHTRCWWFAVQRESQLCLLRPVAVRPLSCCASCLCSSPELVHSEARIHSLHVWY